MHGPRCLPEHDSPRDSKRQIGVKEGNKRMTTLHLQTNQSKRLPSRLVRPFHPQVSKQQAEENVSAARNESSRGAGPSGAAAGTGDAGAAATAPQGGTAASGQNTGMAAPADAATPMDTTPVPGAAAAGGGAAGATAAATAAGGVVNEAAVQELVGLGFSREMAVGALQAANGNVDEAASMLFGM